MSFLNIFSELITPTLNQLRTFNTAKENLQPDFLQNILKLTFSVVALSTTFGSNTDSPEQEDKAILEVLNEGYDLLDGKENFSPEIDKFIKEELNPELVIFVRYITTTFKSKKPPTQIVHDINSVNVETISEHVQ